MWSETRREPPDTLDRDRIRVDGEHLVARSEQEDEIAARSASRVEHAHAGRDAPAQQLIEHVDVDIAEQFSQLSQGVPECAPAARPSSPGRNLQIREVALGPGP